MKVTKVDSNIHIELTEQEAMHTVGALLPDQLVAILAMTRVMSGDKKLFSMLDEVIGALDGAELQPHAILATKLATDIIRLMLSPPAGEEKTVVE